MSVHFSLNLFLFHNFLLENKPGRTTIKLFLPNSLPYQFLISIIFQFISLWINVKFLYSISFIITVVLVKLNFTDSFNCFFNFLLFYYLISYWLSEMGPNHPLVLALIPLPYQLIFLNYFSFIFSNSAWYMFYLIVFLWRVNILNSYTTSFLSSFRLRLRRMRQEWPARSCL